MAHNTNIPVTIKKNESTGSVTYEISSAATKEPVVATADQMKGMLERSEDDTKRAPKLPILPMATPAARIAMLSTAVSLSDSKTNPFGDANPDYSAKSMEWMAGELLDAPIYWASSDMVDLLTHAAPSMPPTTMTREIMPSPSGVVFFEKAYVGKDARASGGVVHVQAYLWGPCQFDVRESQRIDGAVQEETGEAFRFIGNGISIAPWRKYTYWMPLGRTDWPFDYDTEMAFAPPGYTPEQLESIIEDRRVLAAFFLLSQQTNIATITEHALPNHVRKQLQREQKVIPPPPSVRLVDIHKPRHTNVGKGTRDVEWTKRWWVKGHWRQQAYGPGRTLHRPLYIKPFVKGPDDKPLADPATIVKVWRDVR